MSQLLDALLAPERAQAAPADVYEPHCLITWQSQMEGMDDMGGLGKEIRMADEITEAAP